MKKLSIVTPCYNEEENVRGLRDAVKTVMAGLPVYDYEHIFIDNCSKDRTRAILREMVGEDKKVKAIFNTRNFGHIRSPYYGLLQSTGDAAIILVADFQDPPAMIADLVKTWESGFKIVLCVKDQAEESAAMFAIRKLYYKLVSRLSEVELVKNTTGFGLYDREVIETLRKIDDPYPYFRGLLSDVGYEAAQLMYRQPSRKRGITKNNFYTLYDIAMLGITNHSKIPLRIATMAGFAMAALSLTIAMSYFIYKLAFWSSFSLGLAPIVIGLFFFSSVQLFFIGIIGEYIGAIHTQVLKRPLVIEKERIGEW